MELNIKQIIEKKANKQELSKQEIDFAVMGYTNGSIPDYQMSALVMAIYINSMTEQETFYLTESMLNSGETLDLKKLGTTVDKHSTGGVSDTTTIALAPICACLGVKMLKLSGRGLGHTGGTIDKLEAFDGYKADISIEKAINLVQQNGASMITSTLSLAPADKKIYALRDTTATVDSLPLIASSVMSKKLASGADIIVLDVKYGDGAFMKTKSDAEKLGSLMKKIGEYFGKKVAIVLGDMSQPLGYNIGPKLEAYEAVEVLKGKQSNLYFECVHLASLCLSLSEDISYETAKQKVIDCIKSGKPLEKLKTMITAQGGSLDLFNGLDIKPTMQAKSNKYGTLTKVHTKRLGELVGLMGAVRQTVSDKIDYNVGVITHHKLGDKINKDDVLFDIFAKNKADAETFMPLLKECYVIE